MLGVEMMFNREARRPRVDDDHDDDVKHKAHQEREEPRRGFGFLGGLDIREPFDGEGAPLYIARRPRFVRTGSGVILWNLF
jgi:hypothetical protein